MQNTTPILSILALVLAAPLALAEPESPPGTETPATGGDAALTAPEASPPPVTGSVARASFTTDVVGREPQDSVTSLTTSESKIIFFTELQGLAGQTVTHVWERDGVEMARVPFAVGSARWRVYSTKNLEPSWLGEWKVRVVDEHDRVLHSGQFSYVAATAAPVAEAAPAPSEPEAFPASIE